MSKPKRVKKPNQFQRIMIAMEKSGAVRRDGKSTAAEFKIGPPDVLSDGTVVKRITSLADLADLTIPSVESEADYDQRMADREQDRYDMYEDGRSDGHGESYAERNA